MPLIPVHFTFHSGLKRDLFRNVRLSGSWDAAGILSTQWMESPMIAGLDDCDCPAFRATALLDETQTGSIFQWGVVADTPGAPGTWAIVTEVPDANSALRIRSFILTAAGQQEHYWFALGRRLGAQKLFLDGQPEPAIRFSVWAPHAKQVEVVFANANPADSLNGYLADDGTGIDTSLGTQGAFPMILGDGGIWATDLAQSPELAGFNNFFERPYMFRIVSEQGQVTYKTDLYSRNQIGRGTINPGGSHYTGTYQDLDGDVSCSVVSDPDRVTASFDDTGLTKETLIDADDFWSSEFSPGLMPPQAIEDLLIYELHVGSLGFGSTDAGVFADALDFVPRLVELGVNAVELLPVLQFDGDKQWGYGTSHFFCLQTSAGGANQLKHFVRSCHRNGIAVILDVVYNHFSTTNGERAEWGYDSDPLQSPEHNLYQWYEGTPGDYGGDILGGYVNNGSTGFAPSYWQENVRRMFTSSAAALIDDFHIDGFRVDLTGAIHQDNTLNFGGHETVSTANLFGIKLLRELTNTTKLISPAAFLIAEDHTGWSAMTQPRIQGGIGFDLVWYADFYHHLAGDGNFGDDYARLLKQTGLSSESPLHMDYFAGALNATANHKLVYHESHDEAGNGENTERTILTAVNFAPLIGDTRRYAEARSRFAYGMAALSAGTPMFLMGEEIGAAKYFRHGDFYLNKEDLIGQRTADGRFLFRFYQDLNKLVKTPALRSREIDVIYVHNDNRLIVFRRSSGSGQMLIWASLNDRPFDRGYSIQVVPDHLPAGSWREIFNSDSAVYGGDDFGNFGAGISVDEGRMNVIVPAHGFLVFQKVE